MLVIFPIYRFVANSDSLLQSWQNGLQFDLVTSVKILPK